ncbi:hypothetical protein [Pseudoclavibacter helvolus]|uniref:hypothetical protein n=1 Tax=Pseudoclavibacter helvolus TaxID=255205 RepID=UPI003C723682
MTIEVCTGDGLIDPSAFVCKSADLDTSAIEASATSLEGMGTGLVEKVSTISSTWSGIGGSYQAPEQESVYAAITPASNAAADVETSFSSAAGYLRTYAEELQGVKATLQDLEDRAATFRQEALRGYDVTIWDAHGLFSSEFWTTDVTKLGDKSEHIPWTEHGPAIEKNESLLAEYAAIIETVWAAATTCAAGLETLSTGTYVTEDEAITAEAIMASTELPWGYPADEDRNCSESVAHGAGNFWHGTWTGAASLIGRDPESGEWGWDNAGAAWGGLGNFALSTAVVLSPTTWAVKLVAPGSEADQWFDDRVNVAATGWGSLIGWDHQAALAGENGFHAWEEDAVATGTETIANIGTFFIPGANVAKGVSTAGKVGSIVTRVGGFAADFAIPGGSLAVGLATKGIKFSPDGLKITPYVGATGVVDALSPTGGVPPVSSHFGLDAPGTVPGGPKGGTLELPTGTGTPGAGQMHPGAVEPAHPGGQGQPGPSSAAAGPVADGPGGSPRGPSTVSTDVPEVRDPGSAQESSGGKEPSAGDRSPDATGKPASTGGVDDPSSIDPKGVTKGVNDTVPVLSEEYHGAVSDRVEAVAAHQEAVGAQQSVIDQLGEQGVDVDPKGLTKGKIDSTIDALLEEAELDTSLTDAQFEARVDALEELRDTSWQERDTAVTQVNASEAMGDQAALDAIASQDATVVVDGSGGGKGTFDQVGLTNDGTTLIVTEAKGGTATLSKDGRVLPDGTRAPQGSTHYFNDVFQNDPNLAAYLRDNPHIAQGLADGSVTVSYQLVKATPTGKVKIDELVLNPNELDLGLGK